jgi:glycosyltransferase involved in cell wall biosynthesis
MLVALDRPFTFVLPESHASISGGNLYNAALLAALKERHSVLEGGFESWSAEPPGPGIHLIDSINLVDFHALQVQRRTGRQLLLLVHHLPSLEPGLPHDDAGLAAESELLRTLDAFVCTSEFTAEYLRAKGCTQPILTLEPVIEVPEVEARGTGQGVRALMSCNLIAGKGVLALLQSLAEETTTSDAYRLDIVGRIDKEADYGAACQQFVDSGDLISSRVHLRGEAPYRDMAGWYRDANLFLSASRMETFGISLQEARFFGLPILAVEGGNSANHVESGVTGNLFSNPSDLARGFLSLVRTPELLRSYMHEAHARRPPNGGSWSASADQLVQSLEQWFPCR